MRPRSLRDIQKDILPKALHQFIFKAFDHIGDIAILDIPEQLIKYEKKIAQNLLAEHKTIRTVCKKQGNRFGTFRRQGLKILAGNRSYETTHKEYGVRLNLHVRDVYFSPRMCTERKRIADQVKKGEKVLVMFSGCAPYPLVIAKNAEPELVVGIELNPVAHQYAQDNIRINKLNNIKVICGDARKETPKLKEHWDRIVMAWPHKGEDFLDVGVAAAKKGTILHYYDFGTEEEMGQIKKKVTDACKQQNRKCKVLAVEKCGQNAPRSYRIVVDVKLLD